MANLIHPRDISTHIISYETNRFLKYVIISMRQAMFNISTQDKIKIHVKC